MARPANRPTRSKRGPRGVRRMQRRSCGGGAPRHGGAGTAVAGINGARQTTGFQAQDSCATLPPDVARARHAAWTRSSRQHGQQGSAGQGAGAQSEETGGGLRCAKETLGGSAPHPSHQRHLAVKHSSTRAAAVGRCRGRACCGGSKREGQRASPRVVTADRPNARPRPPSCHHHHREAPWETCCHIIKWKSTGSSRPGRAGRRGGLRAGFCRT